MASYIPYVKLTRVSQDGTTPLYVCYNYNRARRTLISTGYSIKPIHWDDKKKLVKRACPDYEDINDTLTRIITKLGKIISYAKDNSIDPTVDFVLQEIAKDKEYEQRSNRIDLFKTLEVYIEEKRPFVSADQVKDYKSLRKHLMSFTQYSSQPVTFRNLNFKFYNEFMDYLYNKAIKPDGTVGLVTNSAGKIIRLLKGFVNYQVTKGIIPAVDLSKFKVVEEETDAIYLTEKEIKAIYELNLTDDNELEEIRDIFVVGCYTGLRYSDLSTLSAEHIDQVNGYINIKQRKVHKSVVIPMIDYVPVILQKYNYNLPKVPSYKFNERIKELGKKINLNLQVTLVHKKGSARVTHVFKKWELISSHTCRRSFCTNMYLAGFPAEELMKISGHKNPSAFMRYIKVDNMQAANRLKNFRKQATNE